MVFNLGTRVLAKYESPINGKVEVIKSIAWGTYVQVGGLTQSGGVVYSVWKTTLKKVRGKKQEIKNCLILGLAGGSAAKLVRQFWPESKLVGVDIDPIMIDIGKKFLGLDEIGVEAIVGDAIEVIAENKKVSSKHFDLIIIDMYVGTEVPEQFENIEFIRSIKNLLSKDGVAVFNRLYYGEKKQKAKDFMDLLSDEFSVVDPVYPEANVMYVCEK